MVEYFKLAISKYAEFTGRSRRSEFWYFILGSFLINLIATFAADAIGISLLANIVSLALLIPTIAVGVRRLHDIDRSGWWALIYFTGIGILVLIYWWAKDSQPGANEYGANPKTGEAADITSHLVD